MNNWACELGGCHVSWVGVANWSCELGGCHVSWVGVANWACDLSWVGLTPKVPATCTSCSIYQTY